MRKVFVHRYKWSHDKRRKQLRSAYRDGLVTLIKQEYDGWLYGIPESYTKKIK